MEQAGGLEQDDEVCPESWQVQQNVEAGFKGAGVAKGRKGNGFLDEEVISIFFVNKDFNCFEGEAIVEGSSGGKRS